MRSVQWMVVAALSAALACGDSSSDKDSSGDGGTGSGGKDSGGASSGGSCAPGAGAEAPAGCSEAQVKEYQACFDDACGSQLEACYGTGYKNGKFGGPCKDYITCTAECDCDVACIQKCTPSSECAECTKGIGSCGLSCTSKLQCAYADSGLSFGDGGITVGDATISFGGTCQDLADCCDTLAADEKSTCTMAYDQLKASGDLACGVLVNQFCP
jgi:hypothetical protein